MISYLRISFFLNHLQKKEKTTTTVIDLFKTPNIRLMTLVLAFNW